MGFLSYWTEVTIKYHTVSYIYLCCLVTLLSFSSFLQVSHLFQKLQFSFFHLHPFLVLFLPLQRRWLFLKRNKQVVKPVVSYQSEIRTVNDEASKSSRPVKHIFETRSNTCGYILKSVHVHLIREEVYISH